MGYYTVHIFSELGTPVLHTQEFADTFKHYTGGIPFNSDYLEVACKGNLIPDMIKVSTHFPTTAFTIRGMGEDYDDYWTAAIFNGEYVKEYDRIILPEIDISKIGNFGQLFPELFI